MLFARDKIEVIFAGGQSAIGEKNGIIIRVGKYALVIDWGQKIQHAEPIEESGSYGMGDLPDDCYPDINLLSGLTVLGFCATHGHLDHIGGWHKLYERYPNVPVITSRFTDKVIRMIGERNSKERFFSPFHDENLQLGPFKIRRFGVNHSIPGSSGFLIEVVDEKSGKVRARIVITGDFKAWKLWEDDDKKLIDKNDDVFGELAKTGPIDLLIADITNIEKDSEVISENAVARNVEKILLRERGRAFVTTISSNVMRQRLIIEKASRMNRKVYVAGRSMREFLGLDGVSEFTKVFVVPENGSGKRDSQVFSLRPSLDTWPDDAVILCTGALGDRSSFLGNMAEGRIVLPKRSRDTLIVSQGIIPREDTKDRFWRMTNNFVKNQQFASIHLPDTTVWITNGTEVFRHEGQNAIHASGHGMREQKKMVFDKIKPRVLIWCHGEEAIRQVGTDFTNNEWGGKSFMVGDGERYAL